MQVVITKEFIDSLKTPKGGLTKEAYAILGVPDWRKPWRHEFIGTTRDIDMDAVQEMRKRNWKPAKPSATQELLEEFSKIEQSPTSGGFDLRMDLMEILHRHAPSTKRSACEEIAKVAGVDVNVVMNAMCADQDLTFDTAGRIIHALGLKPRLAVKRK